MRDGGADEERREGEPESSIPAGRQGEPAHGGAQEVAELQRSGADTGDAEDELGSQVEPGGGTCERPPSGQKRKYREHGEAEPHVQAERAEHRDRHGGAERQRDQESASMVIDPAAKEQIPGDENERGGAQNEARLARTRARRTRRRAHR